MATEAPQWQLSDEEIAEQICTTLTYGGRQFKYGEFVAIFTGEIVAVGDSFDDVDQALLERGVDYGRGLVVRVAPPVPDVIRRAS